MRAYFPRRKKIKIFIEKVLTKGGKLYIIANAPSRRPVGQAVKTAASHAANGSSILPRVTTKYALLAQLVEQLTLNQRAQGSSPWKRTIYSSLAQSVEHAAVNRRVVGSSPTGGAKIKEHIFGCALFLFAVLQILSFCGGVLPGLFNRPGFCCLWGRC